MQEAIKNFVLAIFGQANWLATIILSMIPVTELRVAIPFAMNFSIWGGFVLPWWKAWLFAVIGSTLPAFIIIPLLLPVFNWMKKTKGFRKIAEFFDRHFAKKSASLTKKIESEDELKKKETKKFFGVMIFVGIPFPLTGAWTGSAVAAYLKMPWWKGVLAVFCGNIVSGGIVTLLASLFTGFESIINYVFFGLIGVVIIFSVIYGIINSRRNKLAEAKNDKK